MHATNSNKSAIEYYKKRIVDNEKGIMHLENEDGKIIFSYDIQLCTCDRSVSVAA